VNSTVTTFFVGEDHIPPSVFDLRPVENSTFNASDTIEIAANLTDNREEETVYANITLPNGSTVILDLILVFGKKLNSSYTIPPLLGQYNITFVGNDTISGNVNDTETTFFNAVDQINPTVINATPAQGSEFLVNESVNISVITTDYIGVQNVTAAVTYPDGSVVSLPLVAGSGNAYYTAFSSINQKGTYNITFTANDSSGNMNNTVTTSFRRIVFNNGTLDLINAFNNSMNITTRVISNVSGLLGVEVNLTNLNVHQLIIYNYSEDSPYNVLKFTNNTNDSTRFSTTYSIDPSELNFTLMNVTATASPAANALYKCVNFSFDNQTCNDGYELLLNLTPGENYSFMLNAPSPETRNGPRPIHA